jgi:hypothetical protein
VTPGKAITWLVIAFIAEFTANAFLPCVTGVEDPGPIFLKMEVPEAGAVDPLGELPWIGPIGPPAGPIPDSLPIAAWPIAAWPIAVWPIAVWPIAAWPMPIGITPTDIPIRCEIGDSQTFTKLGGALASGGPMGLTAPAGTGVTTAAPGGRSCRGVWESVGLPSMDRGWSFSSWESVEGREMGVVGGGGGIETEPGVVMTAGGGERLE